MISGHSPHEPVVGFSRAVVAGEHVFVSGTAPIPADGSPPPAGVYDQARLCLEIIAEALGRAGARLDDVVRTRLYLTDPADFPEVARAHADVFGDIRPASTALVIALVDPAWKVEIEADALRP